MTEDVDTLPDGRMEVQIAAEIIREFSSQATPLRGSLVRVPIIGINYGLGERAEVQLRVPVRQFFSPTGETSRSASGDLALSTKLRLLGGHGIWPGLGVRTTVKLPNISETTGIGTDETDVILEFLAGIDLAGVSVATSAGMAILGDPLMAASQNDKFVFGAGLMLPLGTLEFAADVHGSVSGDEGASDQWLALAGLAAEVGPVRLDGAIGSLSQDGQRSPTMSFGASFSFPLR